MHRIITMDGPAGSGKSTLAKEIAKRLGFTFLDTGALYRAAAVALNESRCNVNSDDECASIIRGAKINISGSNTFLNGKNISEEIRLNKISELASIIAVHPSVRNELLKIQRSFKGTTSLIAEGRDTGTVVFPDADIKFYITASPQERARRRLLDLEAKGSTVSVTQIENEIKKRDQRDTERMHSPLTIPEDAIVVDTTHIRFEEVVEKILSHIKEKLTDQ